MLPRKLNHYDGAALIISNVVGVGIFTTPGIVAGLVPERGPFLLTWLAGGLVALVGALVYAELATLLPRSGGEYLYLREAFGPLWGFLSGWTSFIAGFSGAIAAAAVGFAAYLGRFWPAAASTEPLVELPGILAHLELSSRSLVALGVIAGVSLIHVLGVGPGKHFQRWLAVGCLVAITVLVAAGLASEGAVAAPPESQPIDPGFSAWLLALVPVLFTYSGWNAAVYVAEEIRDPERNLLRALLGGTAVVIVAYVALNFLYLHALPMDRLAGTLEVGDATAEFLFGDFGASLLTIGVLLALGASVGAMVMAAPRVYYAMAQDGLFPHSVAEIHPRFGTPARAIVAQAGWSAILVLTGTFEALLIYTGFAVILFAGVAAVALMVVRRQVGERSKNWPWIFGNRFLPPAFALLSLLVVANAVYRSPMASGFGLLVIAAGAPLYFFWRRRGS